MSVGLDLGTTSFKILAVDGDGSDVAGARRPTPWRMLEHRRCMSGDDVLTAVRHLLVELGAALEGCQVAGIGVTGMAEAGFLLGAKGDLRSNAIAWHDPSGAEEAAELRRQFGATVAGRTGLRQAERCSAVKIAWMTGRRPEPGLGWANLPEWVVWQLGGIRASELSLATRTGMLDVTTRSWWIPVVEWCGLDVTVMPEPTQAGTPLGRVDRSLLGYAGAVLTVGGHDHLCAAIGAGALGDEDAFDSFGTGEAVLRSVPPAQIAEDAAHAVQAGHSRGPHVLPGRDYVMAALGSGRILHDVLRELGVADEDRRRLDDDAEAEDGDAALAVARDLLGEDGALKADPSTWPAGRVWRAALEYTARRCRKALETMDQLHGPRAELYAAGGWFRSAFIRELRARTVGSARIPVTTEAGARGAARFAAVAASVIPALSSWRDTWVEAAGVNTRNGTTQ